MLAPVSLKCKGLLAPISGKRLLGRGRKGGRETVAAGHCGARPRLMTLTLWGSPTHSGPGSAWSAVAVEGAEAPQAPPHCSAPGGD